MGKLLCRQLKPLRTAPVASDGILGGFMNMRTELEAKILVAKEQAYYVNHYANMLADIAMDFDRTPEAVIAFVSRSMERTFTRTRRFAPIGTKCLIRTKRSIIDLQIGIVQSI